MSQTSITNNYGEDPETPRLRREAGFLVYVLAARLRDSAGGSLSERHLSLVSLTDLYTSRLARGECLLHFPESAVASCNGRRSVCEGREQHRHPNVLTIRLYLGSVGLGVSLPVGGAAE